MRNARSRKSPSKRADASIRLASSRFFAAASALRSRCPGDEISSCVFPMSPRVPAAENDSRTVRSSSTGGTASGERYFRSFVFRSAERTASSGEAGSSFRIPAPAVSSARIREKAVCRSRPERTMPEASMPKRPVRSRTESPQRSVNAVRRICSAMSAPRLYTESIVRSSGARAMNAGSNPAAGRWPSRPYSTLLPVSATRPTRTVHGADASVVPAEVPLSASVGSVR